MKNLYLRLVVLLFAGLLAMQTASGHFVLCLCEDGPAAIEMPQDPGCCSAEGAFPGVLAMETPDPGGCEDCVKVPLCSNELRGRDLPSSRSALVGGSQPVLLLPAAPSGTLQHPPLAGRPYAPTPPSSVIRV